VADDLCSFAHSAEERPLRCRSIARQNDAKHFETEHGYDKENCDVELHADPAIGKGERQVSAERCTEADIGRHAKKHAVRIGWHQIFFGDQLDTVSQRLQPAEFAADASWTKP